MRDDMIFIACLFSPASSASLMKSASTLIGKMDDVHMAKGYVGVTFDVLYSESTIVYLFVEAFP